jgi:hypothetical protein
MFGFRELAILEFFAEGLLICLGDMAMIITCAFGVLGPNSLEAFLLFRC